MINLSNLDELTDELSSAITNLSSYHSMMRQYTNFYKDSAFYRLPNGRLSGQDQLPDNWLQMFADKNIQYTSGEPTIKIIGTPEDRDAASLREKILYAVRQKSGSANLQKLWARDATKKSLAIAETVFDLEERCVKIKRHSPLRVYWQISNGGDRRVTAFWACFPITKQECIKRYGVTPTSDKISGLRMQNPEFRTIDGQDWFMQVIRWDDETRAAWVGNRWLEKAHPHMLGEIPIDICTPFPDEDNTKQFGEFYLRPLIPLQAELNDVLRRKSNISKRMGQPLIWARGLQTKNSDDIKAALRDGTSGVVGLGSKGEAGILQLSETNMLDTHLAGIKADMQRLSGFAAASFGESVGANTSGDALGMYFTPTQKHIDDQNISWIDFHQSINAKILKYYDVFGRTGEAFSLTGYAPASTVYGISPEQKGQYSQSSQFSIQFKSKDVIAGRYDSKIIMPPVIPKNEIEEKRFWKEGADSKFISRRTAYEHIGIESPEDELAMLQLEQADPVLNLDGASTLLTAANQLQSPTQSPVQPVSPQLQV